MSLDRDNDFDYGLTPESIDRLIAENLAYDDEYPEDDVEAILEEFYI